MKGAINLLLLLFMILNVWLYRYLRWRLIKKYDGYDKFAREVSAGVTIVFLKSKNVPPGFRKEWDRLNATYGLSIVITLLLTLVVLLAFNILI
jgi:hypothetical protein